MKKKKVMLITPPYHSGVVESAGKVVDDVVVAAVRTWKYQPATKQGVRVKVHMMFKQTFLGG